MLLAEAVVFTELVAASDCVVCAVSLLIPSTRAVGFAVAADATLRVLALFGDGDAVHTQSLPLNAHD